METSLKNKIVRVKNRGIIQFLYPDITVREELSFLDRDNFVLYCGKGRPNVKKYLQENTKEFIAVVEMDVSPDDRLKAAPDIDLLGDDKNKTNLINFVAECKGKSVPKRVATLAENLDELEIEEMCKAFWITSKWLGVAIEDGEEDTLGLFNEIVRGNVVSVLSYYFKLREFVEYPILRSDICTRLCMATADDPDSAWSGRSDYYKQSLAKLSERSKPKIRKLMEAFAVDDSEQMFIYILMELMKRG